MFYNILTVDEISKCIGKDNKAVIGIKDNNKAITEIFFSKDKIGDDIKETDLINKWKTYRIWRRT